MSKIDIAIVDYGMGNLRSVSKALEHVAPTKTVLVTSNPDDIINAERVVFPGQGAMPDCIRELDARGLRDAVVSAAQNKPFLGICIGLQMLFERSEEGGALGLGLLKGGVKKFVSADMMDNQGEKLKVPHMGWNQVYQTHVNQTPVKQTSINQTHINKIQVSEAKTHVLWQGIADGARFYYVHSYYVLPADESIIAGYSNYPNKFTCAIAQDNLFAVQFHPEKSADAGLQLLSNFVAWLPASITT